MQARPATRSVSRRRGITKSIAARGFSSRLVRVGTAVAGVLGHDQPALVEHAHEAGRPAARRRVAVAAGAGGGEQEERRTGDEIAAVRVEMVDLLPQRRRVLGGWRHDLPELRLALHDLAERILRHGRTIAAAAVWSHGASGTAPAVASGIPPRRRNLARLGQKPSGQLNQRRGRVKKALIAAIAALAVAIVAAPAASAIDKVNTGKLRKGVTVDGVLDHARALQDIAIANDGTRAATTPGYDASVQYVANRLRRAGYRVTLDPFDFPTWELN